MVSVLVTTIRLPADSGPTYPAGSVTAATRLALISMAEIFADPERRRCPPSITSAG
jgi:hypothetical protein